MKDLISIIIPVYKVEKYIHRCLESVINQTYTNLEVILIDDGSPDDCGKICDEYAKKDNRIKVVHKQNGGQSEARNQGLEIASGEYIGFVDSDNYIKEDMFEVLYKTMLKYDADITICNIVKTNNATNECLENYKDIEIYDKSNSMQKLLNNHITNYIYNKLYKRELWEGIHFPVGKILEDMDVMYRIIEKAKKIICTNKTEYYYFIRQDSSIAKIDVKVTKDLRNVVNKRYQYLKKERPDLIDLLIITRMFNIIQYHDNLAHCNEYKIYKSKEFIEEYNFYKKNFRNYKKELYKGKSSRKKIEMFLLYMNRTLYYYYSRVRTITKDKLKNNTK